MRKDVLAIVFIPVPQVMVQLRRYGKQRLMDLKDRSTITAWSRLRRGPPTCATSDESMIGIELTCFDHFDGFLVLDEKRSDGKSEKLGVL